mmetsp:Transcript_35035/g.112850  ORF Transcript_35035/g.112850 Transcript_35035/m.112850 type:complete len:243 (-) Transcript_35035:2733-3461(-)
MPHLSPLSLSLSVSIDLRWAPSTACSMPSHKGILHPVLYQCCSCFSPQKSAETTAHLRSISLFPALLLVDDGLLWQHVADVVPRVAVQPLLQPLLVEKVTDEANGSAKHEETVEHARIQVLCRLLGREDTRVAQEVDECGADGAVHIKNQVGLFAGGQLLHLHGEVEHVVPGEVCLDETLEDLDALVGILKRFDAVADAHDQSLLIPHLVDELLRRQARVHRGREHGGGAVDGTSEPRPDGQ